MYARSRVVRWRTGLFAEVWPVHAANVRRAVARVQLAIASGAAGNLAGGALLTRGVRPASLVMAALALSASVALLVAMASLGAWPRYWLVVAFATVAGLVPPALFAEAPSQAPHASTLGLTLGMMMQGNNLGLVIGPAAGAALSAAAGWPGLAAGAAAMAVTGIAVVVCLLPRPAAGLRTRQATGTQAS